MIRVLICDDHVIVRQGLRQMLADAGDIEPAGEAADGPAALAAVRKAAADGALPDVVLLDIAMPQRDGLDVLKALKDDFPKLPVLILSTYPDRQYAVRSLKLGAAGYLNKSADSEQIIAAIRKVAAGGLFITPSIAEQLAGALGAGAWAYYDTSQVAATAIEFFSGIIDVQGEDAEWLGEDPDPSAAQPPEGSR